MYLGLRGVWNGEITESSTFFFICLVSSLQIAFERRPRAFSFATKTLILEPFLNLTYISLFLVEKSSISFLNIGDHSQSSSMIFSDTINFACFSVAAPIRNFVPL